MSTRRTKPAGAHTGPEDKFQESAIKRVRDILKEAGYAPELAMHIPNGGYRHPRTAAKLKKQGVVPGYPDIMVLVPLCGDSGLCIELKVWPNKPSPEQVKMHERLKARGYDVNVCYGLGEVEKITREYFMVPTL